MKFTVDREEIRHIIIGLSNTFGEFCKISDTMPAITLKTLAKLASLYNKSIRGETVSFELDYIYAIDLKLSLGYAWKFSLSIPDEPWHYVIKWNYMLKEALESWRD